MTNQERANEIVLKYYGERCGEFENAITKALTLACKEGEKKGAKESINIIEEYDYQDGTDTRVVIPKIIATIIKRNDLNYDK